MEETKAKGNCFKEPAGLSRAREDIISELPDSLISEILSYLPTKEAVRTCVLSNRWKSVWLLIPGLDLISSMFPNYNAFVSTIDRFLDSSRKENSCLHKLKLSIIKDENDQSCVPRWVDFVATRKLKHLDVQYLLMKRQCLEVMPLSLYICETLLYLRLYKVSLGRFECVSLPCVKTMRLENNLYVNDACLESLISSCPVLEDLIFVKRYKDDNVKVLRVHSQRLTSLSIEVGMCQDDYEYSGFIIDAPRLKFLNIQDATSKNKTISNPGSLISVNIYRSTDISANEVNFFTSLSGVRNMKITWGIFASIIPVPQFCNLSCLEVELHCFSMEKLTKFLESCPNLRSLILNFRTSFMSTRMSLTTVPPCLRSSLEFVEIERNQGLDKSLCESSNVLCRELSNFEETCSTFRSFRRRFYE